MMKRIIQALVVLCLTAGVAIANWNIQQRGDGSAVWVNQSGDTVPVGDSGLTTYMADLSTQSTSYVVTQKSGYIRKIYLTAGAQSTMLTSNVTFLIAHGDFGIANNTTGYAVFKPVSAGSTSISLGNIYGPSGIAVQTSGYAGWTSSVIFPNNIVGRTNWVTAGTTIAINTDGAGSSTVPGYFTIVIE